MFRPFVDRGFLKICYGGASAGAFLCNHPKVEAIHLTGSAATYDAIVWGPGVKDKSGTPKLTKQVDAELGCVTPYIVVPGAWTDAEINEQAEQVAAGLCNNAGHNCLAAEVVITDKHWPLRDKFLDALRTCLRRYPNRVAYYPHSDARFEAFRRQFPDCERIESECTASPSTTTTPTRPWLLRAGLSPDQVNGTTENWCGVLQEVALDSSSSSSACDPARFMKIAAEFANDKLWGTLSCTVLCDPKIQTTHEYAFDGMIEALRYGCITVNAPGLLGVGVTSAVWGAYPGNDIRVRARAHSCHGQTA